MLTVWGRVLISRRVESVVVEFWVDCWKWRSSREARAGTTSTNTGTDTTGTGSGTGTDTRFGGVWRADQKGLHSFLLLPGFGTATHGFHTDTSVPATHDHDEPARALVRYCYRRRHASLQPRPGKITWGEIRSLAWWASLRRARAPP